jgi:hypothetical protein
MLNETTEPPLGNDLPQNSSLHGKSQAAPVGSLKHERIESKQIACDIGFERALTEWIIKRRSKWCKNRQPEPS